MKRKVTVIILTAFMIGSFYNGIYSYDSRGEETKVEEPKDIEKEILAENEELRFA